MKVNKIYYLLIIASFAIISACDKEDKQVVTGISISKKSFLLTEGEIEGVWITFEPNGSSDKVTWVSSDNEIATVSVSSYMPSKAKIKAIGPGHAVISALVGDLKTECSVSVAVVPKGAVDLGVIIQREDGSWYRLFWAESNLCESGLSSNPEDYGDYYSWGELVPHYTSLDPLTWRDGKSGYNWSSYKWGKDDKVIRYCPLDKQDKWGGSGNPDNKLEFKDYDYVDDAARATLGGNWRIPTEYEWRELERQCSVWMNTYSETGVGGRVYKGKYGFSNTSIFLPAAGYWTYDGKHDVNVCGNYWTSSLYTELSNSPVCAGSLHFSLEPQSLVPVARYNGFSVRPVTEGITEKP